MRENAPSFHHVYMALARDVVVDTVKRHQGRKIRILEVGAGHGRLTWPLVERLRGENVEYHFTDIGRSFLHVAEREAKKRRIPWMKIFRFDLNRPAHEQGINERYDIILGLDSVHVTLDLPAGLAKLRDMLVPGGALICVESTRIGTCSQLIWGLAPGYWDVATARGALTMTLSDWQRELKQAGFGSVEVVAQNAARQRIENSGLIIAEHSIQVADTSMSTLRNSMTPPLASRAPGPIAALDESRPASRTPPSTIATGNAPTIAQHLWQRMLGVPHVSPGANFFELGGDSLLAVHFLAEFNLRTGQKIKMAQFMKDPTIHGTVALADSSVATTSVPIPRLRHDLETQPDSAPHSLGRPFIETTQRIHVPPAPPTHSEVPALEQDGVELRAFLDRFVQWMCNRDAAALGAMFTPDERCTLVTVGDSIIEGSKTITKHYTRKMASLVELRAQVREAKFFVFAGGRAASITARLDSDQLFAEGMRRVTYRDTRLTLVLEKHEGTWRAVNLHYSLPVGGPVETLD